MEQMRSFIAIELPDDLKVKLAQLEAQLKSGEPSGVRWVDPNSIHLTLKFLGDIAMGRIGEITMAMEKAARAVSPFHLDVKNLGVFPNLKRVQVVWVGMSGEVAQLEQLQHSIESNLARLGFAPERRPFMAHLTLGRLGRLASLDERQRFGQLITETKFAANHSIKGDSISLMRSQLTREGAIYSRISSVRLINPLPTTTA